MQRPACISKTYTASLILFLCLCFQGLFYQAFFLRRLTLEYMNDYDGTGISRSMRLEILPHRASENKSTASLSNENANTTTPLLQEAVVPLSSLRRGGSPSKDRNSPSTASNSDVVIAVEKKNAYAFQIGGCDPSKVTPGYRPFLYGVYNAIYALKYKHGSKADFHVWVEMIHGSPHKALPADEERVLRELGAVVHYIPAGPGQSFYRTQLQKFRLLGLEQYAHVWHLDGDILPLSNLDYVFDLMDQGILRQNVAFLEGSMPASGGCFIVTPRPGALKEINQIIQKKERPLKEWDPIIGWGHKVVAPDRWVTILKGMKSTWDFHAADGDQGLLLYWIKYVEKDVSFLNIPGGKIEHWGPASVGEDDNGRQPVKLLEVTKKDPLQKLEKTLPENICFSRLDCDKLRPQRDYFHFSGDNKPWYAGLRLDYGPKTQRKTVHHYWYSLLDEINQKHRLGLNATIFGQKFAKHGKNVRSLNYAAFQMAQRYNNGTFTTLID